MAFVQTRDEELAYKEHGIGSFPALALYRNGDFVRCEELLEDQDAVKRWVLDTDTLRLEGKIEEVNQKMLNYLYEEVDNLVVFFYGMWFCFSLYSEFVL